MSGDWTDGPWTVDGRCVTSVDMHPSECIVDHVYGPEGNAHLIASAPDLFDALVVALAMSGLGMPWNERARAALAKARGNP